jgi:long-chain fatty acid transport protein
MAGPHRWVLCLIACALATGAAARAQSNDEINSGIQFNFSTPGARSLGLGGAFLALADDATAAYTNPAGLTNLTIGGPEVSVELRDWGYTNVFNERGHVSGEPTGIGIDSMAGIQQGEAESDAKGLSFLSFGYVLPRGLTLALYRHELANFQAEIGSQGFFVGGNRTNPTLSEIDLRITSYGTAMAYALRVPEPRLFRRAVRVGPGPGGDERRTDERGGSLSVGLGVAYYELRLDSLTRRFGRAARTRDDALDRLPGQFFGVAETLDDNILNRQSQQGEDADVSGSLGFLWRIDREQRWSLGGVYRRGPRFDVDVARRRAVSARQPQTVVDPLDLRSEMRVPDVVGLGVAWSGEEGRTKVLFDLDRVFYSQLSDRMANLFTVAEPSDLPDFRIEDGNEYHLGFEHVLPLVGSAIVGTIRVGAWYDPAHSLEYVGSKTLISVRYPRGQDEMHFAAGAGLVFQENFQVDLAVDLSERIDTFSLSAVKFF